MKLIRILGASIAVLVLLPRLIEESHALDMLVDFLIGEEVAKVRIFEWIVIGQRHLVDVIGVDELFLGPEGRTPAPAHLKIKLMNNIMQQKRVLMKICELG